MRFFVEFSVKKLECCKVERLNKLGIPNTKHNNFTTFQRSNLTTFHYNIPTFQPYNLTTISYLCLQTRNYE
jgi:hypothetical protein